MRLLATRPPGKSHRPLILQTGNSGPEWRRSYSNDSKADTGTRTPGSQDRVTAAAQPRTDLRTDLAGGEALGQVDKGQCGVLLKDFRRMVRALPLSYKKGQGLRI